MKSLLGIFVCLAVATVACSSNTSTNGGSANVEGNTTGGQCTPNDTDGRSSCSLQTCEGGEYCSINICKPGCLTTANCPVDQFCDMAAASEEPSSGKSIGICRACPTKPSGGGKPAAGECSDVHGVYNLSPSSSSSEGCGELASECTVTQDGCDLTASCEGAGTYSFAIDSSDKGSFTTTFVMGAQSVNANCKASFTDSGMTLDCQFTASQGVAVCKASGRKK